MKSQQAVEAFRKHCGKGYGPAWSGIIFVKSVACLVLVPGATFSRTRRVHVFPGGEYLKVATMKKVTDYWRHHGHRYQFVADVDIREDLAIRAEGLLGFKLGIPSIIHTERSPYAKADG